MLDALIIGLIQGLTEFIPVSSSGHMVLFHALRGRTLSPDAELAYDAVLQLSTLLAVIVYFRKDILEIIRQIGRGEFTYISYLIIATIPAVIIGLMLENHLAIVRGPFVVAGALIVGSGIMALAEFLTQKKAQAATVTMNCKKSFIIGLFQTLALIPGMSRSGMTLAGGMFNGFTRAEAAKFSFLLSLPIIGGSGLLKLVDVFALPEINLLQLSFASAVALVSGFCAIYIVMKIVSTRNLWPFIWYRLLLAAVILLF